MKSHLRSLLLALAITGGSSATAREPLTTAFSYQGRLQQSGSPATGRHDLRFRLFWQAVGGTQVGPEACVNNVEVVDGHFSVEVDFGNRYDGQRLFLEVLVRPDVGTGCESASGYVTLTPRQELTITPHAGYAMQAGTAANATTLGGQGPSHYLNAANLTGTLADARLSSNVARLNAAQTFSGALTLSNAGNVVSGIGSGLTALNANNISAGTLSAARMPANWAAGGVLAGLYPNPTLAANAVTSAALAADIRTTLSLWAASGADVAASSRRLLVGTGTADANADVTINTARSFAAKGTSSASGGAGLWGVGSGANGSGVYGSSSGTGGTGVKGVATGVDGYGGYFENQATSGSGLFGRASATTGSASGVRGESNAPSGAGVWGMTSAGGATSSGVYGANTSTGASTSPGVKGESQASGGVGVLGTVAGNDSIGVRGESGGTTASSYGVLGQSNSGAGVRGESGFGPGVSGTSTTGSGVSGTSTSGSGVVGTASAAAAPAVVGTHSGSGAGVSGTSTTGSGVTGTSTSGSGVVGTASAAASPAVVGTHSGGGVGLSGSSATGKGVEATSVSGVGLRAVSTSGRAIEAITGAGRAIHAESAGTDSAALYGTSNTGLGLQAVSTSGTAASVNSSSGTALLAVAGTGGMNAVKAESNSSAFATIEVAQGGTGRAIQAVNNSASNPTIWVNNQGGGVGVRAFSTADFGVFGSSNQGFGVAGSSAAQSTSYVAGVQGNFEPGSSFSGARSLHAGVYGRSASRSGVGYLGYGVIANGGFLVAGATKDFGMDHPLDPANKFLFHACAEGPEPLNMYSGTVILGDDGTAEVRLPDYFEAINKDPRYQLTPIGAPALLYVVEEIKNNRFVIGGGKPGMKVSWAVNGVRNDLAMQATPPRTEVDKPDELKGYYLTPQLYGFGEERSVFFPSPKPKEGSPTQRGQ